MNSGLPSLDPTFLFILIPGIVGLIALYRGLWPRRRGTTPYCAKCGYNLTLHASTRCPECGADTSLAGAIVTGERRRRLAMVLVGVGCLSLASAPVVNSFLDVDWYQFAPTSWVFEDLQSSNPTLVQRAWNEIDRRLAKDSLTALQRSTLIDLGLKEQIADNSRNVSDKLLEFLGAAYAAEELSEKQSSMFLDQSIDFDIIVRKRCSPKDPVRYETWVNLRPLPVVPLRYTITCLSSQLDGKSLFDEADAVRELVNQAIERPANDPRGGADSDHLLKDIPPGNHMLAFTVLIKTFPCDEKPSGTRYDGLLNQDKLEWGPPIRERTITVSREFEVLAEEP